jgi:single-strand DNA-binding protein
MFQVSFIGNVGRDPEQRESQSGAQYTSFSVAVRTRDPDNPEWVHVQVWGKLGEWALRDVQKGSSVWIGGQGDLNRWENRDGEVQVNLSVRADIVRFAGPKPAESGNRNRNRSNSRRPPRSEPEPF